MAKNPGVGKGGANGIGGSKLPTPPKMGVTGNGKRGGK